MSPRWPLAVVGILAVGGAAAAGAFFLWPSGDTATTCAGSVHAPVPAEAQTALAAYTGRIKHTSEGSALSPSKESWFDPTTGNNRDVQYDAAGKVTSEFAKVPSGSHARYTWVLYDEGIWMSSTAPDAPLAATDTAVDEAQAFRDKVASGAAVLVGREVLGGRQTLHLRENLAAARSDTWVDALTYVPVRARTGQPGQQSQTATAWLPRTAANVARTKLTVPHGLRRVAPMGLGSDSGSGGGVVLAEPGKGCPQS